MGRIVFVLGVLLFLACSAEKKEKTSDSESNLATESADSVRMLIEFNRKQKDLLFKMDSLNSPFPDSERKKFSRLIYYPIDFKFRKMLKLNRYADPEKVTMATSRGLIKNYRKYGFVEFELAGIRQTLQVYRPDPVFPGQPDYLFIPFKDKTSGKETYGAGRYLEGKEADGKLLVDFNLAYNPWCVYNTEKYNCPYPPKENHLEVAIPAGEKDFHH